MDLQDIRKEIDGLDAELVALFLRRMELAANVAEYKRVNSLPVLDESRERAIVERAEAMAGDAQLRPPVRRLFECVMAESRHLQRQFLMANIAPAPAGRAGEAVAFLGPEGSFSHEALLQHFGAGSGAVPMASFEEVVDAVARGACRYGMLPVENSLTGGVFAAADLLTAGSVRIVGETVLAVRHCLLGLPGAVAADIATVLSHPQPLEQCRQFIRRRGYDTEACGSTAAAAREAAKRGNIAVGAIGSEASGRLNGLEPILRDIQDNPANYTRFSVISAAEEPAEGADKISAVFVVEHRPGTLYGALRAFADCGVNILNLVSRPVPGSPWQYCFHMDFDGNLDDANVQAALREAGKNCRSILILGNYRKWRG